jgi:hypothetical protein
VNLRSASSLSPLVEVPVAGNDAEQMSQHYPVTDDHQHYVIRIQPFSLVP